MDLLSFCVIAGIIFWLLTEHFLIVLGVIVIYITIMAVGLWVTMKKDNHTTSDSDSGFDEDRTLPTSHNEPAPKRHSGKCDGDCANCPPHYGYRYGRWYYGHSHIHGCEFGGNKGDGGRD